MMIYSKIFGILLVLVMFFSVFATAFAVSVKPNDIIYVSMSGNDANDGLTESTSKRTIQNAIKTAPDNGKIHVDKGTYQENIKINKNVDIIGKTPKDTIIDGGLQGSCITIKGTFKKEYTVRIDKFTIKNGKNIIDGGGICNDHSNLTLTNSFILNNTANHGSGIINSYGELNLAYSTVDGNIAFKGGGIYNNHGKLTVTNSFILNNNATEGGGIYSIGELNIIKSTINGNIALNVGGIYNFNGILTIEDSLIKDNLAKEFGGGVYNNNKAEIINTRIESNWARYGGGIYNTDNLVLINSKINKSNWARYGGGIRNMAYACHDKNTKIEGNWYCNYSGNKVKILKE